MKMMSKKGFTLIELLLVVIVMGILLSIAYISSRTWINRYKSEGQMKALYTDMANARLNAMDTKRMFFVVLTSGLNGSYTIYEDTNPSPDGDGALQAGNDRVFIRTSLGYPILFDGGGQIDFNTEGVARRLAGDLQTTIRLDYATIGESFGATYDCLVVSATRIRMGVWNGASCFIK